MVPEFNSDGVLPEGIHESTLEEFEKRFTNYFDRRRLYEKGILLLMADLRVIGCKTLYIDGSYVTKKRIPNDFDACWDNKGIDLAIVKARFPFLWSPLNSKRKYGGDVFPAYIIETRSKKLFIDFFQTDKSTGLKKGDNKIEFMIKNQKQVSITRDKLGELQEALNDLKKKKDIDPLEYELAFNSLSALITDLNGQLEEYEALKSGQFCYTPKSINDIPQQLIAARLALGLSQKELGDELDMKEQQIQRYESTDYETASWVRIAEIAGVLGIKFCFKQTQLDRHKRGKTYDFMIPLNLTEEQIRYAEDNLKNKQLMPVNE